MEFSHFRGPPFAIAASLSQAGEDTAFLAGLSLTTSDSEALGRVGKNLLFHMGLNLFIFCNVTDFLRAWFLITYTSRV